MSLGFRNENVWNDNHFLHKRSDSTPIKGTSKALRMQYLIRSKIHVFSTRDPMLTLKSRKGKPIGQIYGAGFSWPEAIDAGADVYNGVCFSIPSIPRRSLTWE